jgi:hypothetical protein
MAVAVLVDMRLLRLREQAEQAHPASLSSKSFID